MMLVLFTLLPLLRVLSLSITYHSAAPFFLNLQRDWLPGPAFPTIQLFNAGALEAAEALDAANGSSSISASASPAPSAGSAASTASAAPARRAVSLFTAAHGAGCPHHGPGAASASTIEGLKQRVAGYGKASAEKAGVTGARGETGGGAAASKEAHPVGLASAGSPSCVPSLNFEHPTKPGRMAVPTVPELVLWLATYCSFPFDPHSVRIRAAELLPPEAADGSGVGAAALGASDDGFGDGFADDGGEDYDDRDDPAAPASAAASSSARTASASPAFSASAAAASTASSSASSVPATTPASISLMQLAGDMEDDCKSLEGLVFELLWMTALLEQYKKSVLEWQLGVRVAPLAKGTAGDAASGDASSSHGHSHSNGRSTAAYSTFSGPRRLTPAGILAAAARPEAPAHDSDGDDDDGAAVGAVNGGAPPTAAQLLADAAAAIARNPAAQPLTHADRAERSAAVQRYRRLEALVEAARIAVLEKGFYRRVGPGEAALDAAGGFAEAAGIRSAVRTALNDKEEEQQLIAALRAARQLTVPVAAAPAAVAAPRLA